jgi:hypothetical protein
LFPKIFYSPRRTKWIRTYGVDSLLDFSRKNRYGFVLSISRGRCTRHICTYKVHTCTCSFFAVKKFPSSLIFLSLHCLAKRPLPLLLSNPDFQIPIFRMSCVPTTTSFFIAYLRNNFLQGILLHQSNFPFRFSSSRGRIQLTVLVPVSQFGYFSPFSPLSLKFILLSLLKFSFFEAGSFRPQPQQPQQPR